MNNEKLIENIVKLLSKEGFQIVEDNDYLFLLKASPFRAGCRF